ncbi:MAG: ATP-binding protein [Prolixibacteraceae bacterium]|nr:ATP-binding protein [Prolixibacteraceae bacterium]
MPVRGYASMRDMRFDNITPNTGLSNGNIVSITQDHEGFIWIGTAEGLNKYDGLQFTLYKNSRGDTTTLSGNYINTLLEDSKNNLWVGLDKGICRYNRNMDYFERMTFPDENNLPFNHTVSAIFEDSHNRIWLGTNIGVFLFDYKNQKFTPYIDEIVADKKVSHIEEDRFGNLYFSFYETGLVKYNPINGQKEIINKDHNIYPLKENDIYDFTIDHKNRIWLGYQSEGISVINEKNQAINHFSHQPNNPNSLPGNYITTIEIDKKGNVLIGTNGNGLSVYYPDSSAFYNYKDTKYEKSLISDVVNQIYVADNGMIWIGCWGSGLSIYDEKLFQFANYKPETHKEKSLSGESVTGFTEDKNGNIWVSTDGGGIDCFNPHNNTFNYYNKDNNPQNALTNNKVLSVQTDEKGGLWAGMWNGGLNYFEIKGHHLILKERYEKLSEDQANNSSIFKLYLDRNGQLWVGSFEKGAYIYNNKSDNFIPLSKIVNSEKDSINQLTINDFLHDLNETYWIATQDFGLMKVDLKNKTQILYKESLDDPLGQPAQLVNFIHKDKKSRLWIGTNAGLSLYNKKTEEFKTYTTEDGLPDVNIVGLLEDDHGHLWISSNKGISKITVNPGEDFPVLEIRSYGLSDGLQGNIFNRWAYYKSSTGNMYFGGLNGFNKFHPDSIIDNKFIPPVHLTDFLLFNKPVPIGKEDSPLKKHISQTDEIILRHNQNYFTIQFVALNYIISSQNKYAYYMDGLDKDWNYFGNSNKATYTHLQPGKYTFRVKASNNDGYWNEEGTSIKITILPPWWLSWWFKLVVTIIILSFIAYWIVKFIRYYKQLTNQTILNERNQLQTLIDNIPDQIYIKDKLSRFIVVNNKTAEIMETANKKSMIYKTNYDFYSKEEAVKLTEQERKIMNTGESLINEATKTIIGGKEFFWSITKTPIVNNKGETLGLVAVIRDVTQQKKAELKITQQSEALKKMNGELLTNNNLLEEHQQQIEEQSEELYNQKEELTKNNKLLNELNATKDMFFSVIAHDIRNPFNVIIGFSDLLLNNINEWNDREIIQAAKMIYESSNKLSELLDNLLQWSRSQRGIIECKPTTVEIEPLVSKFMSLYKYNLDEKNIKMDSRFDVPDCKVYTDTNLLETILRNLIINAIKFTPNEGKIEVGTKKINDNKVILFVSDNGVGIDEENRKNLFNLTTNKSKPGTNNEKGSGLGLILTKDFVEKQGGDIWVESTPGKGTTFYFSIPLAD